jgi:DHA1 family multidrug resistance protein-like MFS transporter
LGTTILLIFVALFNYLADAYGMFTASAIAANTVVRSAAGAAAPLFTRFMFTSLGVGGGGSLIGGVAVLLAPVPFVFYKYGASIRKRSKYAPTEDNENERVQVQRREDVENHEFQSEGDRRDSVNSSSTRIDRSKGLGDGVDLDIEKQDNGRSLNEERRDVPREEEDQREPDVQKME